MRRRLLLLAAAAVPSLIAVAAFAHGCGTEPAFESVCLWMADPDNCYRDFREAQKAYAPTTPQDNPSGDCKPLGNPTEATGAGPGKENGTFLSRAKLDVCILDLGGSVVLDPPLDLTMWPPSPYADPVTYTLKFVAPDGNTCGQATYTSPHGFSITINAPPDAGGSGSGSGGAATTTTSATSTIDASIGTPYGTFTEVIAPGRDAFDVTCPSGETHHFNLNEVSAGDGGTCPAYVDFVPSASFQVYPGGVDKAGAISFAIVYPPVPDAGAVDNYPEDAAAPPTANPPVVYFNCTIPGAPEQCADGVKDGAETDVDCGGPQTPSQTQCGSCPVRCAGMQLCICNDDCASGLVCAVNAMGMRQCQVPAAGLTSFKTCSWKDPALMCSPGTTGDAGAGGSGTGGSGTGGSGTGGAGTGGGPADAGDGG